MTLEVFLDDTPGETRGVIARDGRYERLIVQRETDPPQHRLGARAAGRVIQVEPAYGAAFVDLGAEGPSGFLPLTKSARLKTGDRIEVEVSAEPRESKGPALRLIGPGEGAPRLLLPGPDVAAVLAALAPGVEAQTGAAAIQASWEAQDEALGFGGVFAEAGVDLAIQRARALAAVDIDYAHAPGGDARKSRARANREGLRQAARLIRLKNWGGLVAIDLAGTNLDAEVVKADVRAAFAGDGATLGPLSRFGLMQLSLPWGRRPNDEALNPSALHNRAVGVVRRLRHAILSDTAAPRFIARCAPDEAALAAPLAARLGLRAGVRADAAVMPGRAVIEEG